MQNYINDTILGIIYTKSLG